MQVVIFFCNGGCLISIIQNCTKETDVPRLFVLFIIHVLFLFIFLFLNCPLGSKMPCTSGLRFQSWLMMLHHRWGRGISRAVQIVCDIVCPLRRPSVCSWFVVLRFSISFWMSFSTLWFLARVFKLSEMMMHFFKKVFEHILEYFHCLPGNFSYERARDRGIVLQVQHHPCK